MAAQLNQDQTKGSTLKEQSVQDQTVRIELEKDIFIWKAPSRPFKRRPREFWTTIVAVALIFGFILFIIEGTMPVILMIALIFLFYILSTVEPEAVEYKITNKGVRFAGALTEWDFFTNFWFSKRFESDLVVFGMVTLPGRLELVIHEKDKDAIRKAVAIYLPEEEVSPTNVDKAADWLSQKLPGNQK